MCPLWLRSLVKYLLASEPLDALRSVKLWSLAGEPLAPALVRAIMDKLVIPVVNAYGPEEVGMCTSAQVARKITSMSGPFPLESGFLVTRAMLWTRQERKCQRE